MPTKPWKELRDKVTPEQDAEIRDRVRTGSCHFGCIFHEGRLYGDCRMPESQACAFHPANWLLGLEAGDSVVRELAGSVEMVLKVTEVTEGEIICGPWTFSRRNGAELDRELGWGEERTGSRLLRQALTAEDVEDWT